MGQVMLDIRNGGQHHPIPPDSLMAALAASLMEAAGSLHTPEEREIFASILRPSAHGVRYSGERQLPIVASLGSIEYEVDVPVPSWTPAGSGEELLDHPAFANVTKAWQHLLDGLPPDQAVVLFAFLRPAFHAAEGGQYVHEIEMDELTVQLDFRYMLVDPHQLHGKLAPIPHPYPHPV